MHTSGHKKSVHCSAFVIMSLAMLQQETFATAQYSIRDTSIEEAEAFLSREASLETQFLTKIISSCLSFCLQGKSVRHL